MLEGLKGESKSEKQKEAKADCEHRPLASAAMFAHFKEACLSLIFGVQNKYEKQIKTLEQFPRLGCLVWTLCISARGERFERETTVRPPSTSLLHLDKMADCRTVDRAHSCTL
jgi:hypothetical protein